MEELGLIFPAAVKTAWEAAIKLDCQMVRERRINSALLMLETF